jgi:hypothetical protein
LWVRDTALRLHQEGMDVTRSALNNIKRVGWDGVYMPGNLPYDPYKVPGGGDGTEEDIRWLL